jgi:hypothetical protein
MIRLVIKCDPVPGKQDDLDSFLAHEKREYWLKQAGVSGFHVYGDQLMGWPERTVVIECDDMTTLENALNSPAHKNVRQAFFSLTSRNESQIQNQIL